MKYILNNYITSLEGKKKKINIYSIKKIISHPAKKDDESIKKWYTQIK